MILGCLLVRVGSLFSFRVCEKAVSPMVSLMLFRTFLLHSPPPVMCSHPKFPMQR